MNRGYRSGSSAVRWRGGGCSCPEPASSRCRVGGGAVDCHHRVGGMAGRSRGVGGVAFRGFRGGGAVVDRGVRCHWGAARRIRSGAVCYRRRGAAVPPSAQHGRGRQLFASESSTGVRPRPSGFCGSHERRRADQPNDTTSARSAITSCVVVQHTLDSTEALLRAGHGSQFFWLFAVLLEVSDVPGARFRCLAAVWKFRRPPERVFVFYWFVGGIGGPRNAFSLCFCWLRRLANPGNYCWISRLVCRLWV